MLGVLALGVYSLVGLVAPEWNRYCSALQVSSSLLPALQQPLMRHLLIASCAWLLVYLEKSSRDAGPSLPACLMTE